MADRSTFNGASSEVPWKNTAAVPEGFGDQYARHVKALYDASVLPLTAIGGTAANVTAQVDPAITGGLLDGMKFTLTWGADSAGPTTLKIGSLAAAPVVDASGGALIAGSVKAGQRSLLEYVGGSFRLLGGPGGDGMQGRFFFQFTASTTWVKPLGLAPDTMVLLEVWGGGGGGSKVGSTSDRTGGGGGGYERRWMRYADLPASVAIVIGAGGAGTGNSPGGNGGATSIGALLSTTGGRGGSGSVAGSGEGGGRFGAGLRGAHATHDFRGGGGQVGPSAAGGTAPYGGGGGGGGTSLYGGNGGPQSSSGPGQAPGGGGSRGYDNADGGPGARGEARIWIL